jgi:hypothetical protein
MGLEGIGGGGDTNTLLAAPGLAEVLQKDGKRGENANVLTLFLNNTSLEGGAPAPITQNVGTIPISPTFVFNSNFTRERYGKAAVHPNISLQSDRISLLLDNNQTEAQKALSFISALEFDLGLSAVQAMTNTEVTNRNQPDLDKFEEYPESLFNNATLLNSTKETFVFNAIDASQDATAAFTSYQ